MQYQIRRMSKDNHEFYRLLGPLMGSRQVEKEVGIRMYDDEDKEWFVAFLGLQLIGVASVRGSVISDCYVKTAYRGNCIFTLLLSSAVSANQEKRLTANCTEASLKSFINAGFKVVSSSRNFTRVVR